MQGLAHYDDSPSPESSSAGPSRHKSDPPGPSIPRKRQTEDGDGNLTHIAQSDLQNSELASEPTIRQNEGVEIHNEFEGMSDEEILRRITRPAPIEGLDDWGIPPAVDPEECDPALKAKVAQYLRLKYEHNQHINTSLLSSSSFANPHIYAKLVEFVDLSERATSFPGGGWITRQGIEGEMEKYGPKVMSEEQKRRQEAVKRSQEFGKRSTISFKPGRDQEREKEKGRERDRAREKPKERKYPEMDRRDRSRLLGSSGIGGSRSDREGGWDERDMRRDRDKHRRY